MGKVDENKEYVSQGVTEDLNLTPSSLKVDPTTGRLLIEIVPISAGSPVLNNSKIDENRENTSLVYDGTNTKPLLIDASTGYLSVDITV